MRSVLGRPRGRLGIRLGDVGMTLVVLFLGVNFIMVALSAAR